MPDLVVRRELLRRAGEPFRPAEENRGEDRRSSEQDRDETAFARQEKHDDERRNDVDDSGLTNETRNESGCATGDHQTRFLLLQSAPDQQKSDR